MIRRRPRLTTVSPLLIGLILLLAFGALVMTGPRTINKAMLDLLTSNSRAVFSVSAKLLFNPLYNLDVFSLQRTLNGLPGETNVVHAAVRDTDGQIVAQVTAEEGWVPEEQVGRDLGFQALDQQGIIQREIEDYLVLCGPIAAGSEQIGTLVIAFDQAPLDTINDFIRRSLLPLLILVPVGSILLVAVVIHFAATSPFRVLTTVATEIGRGNLDTPVPIRGMEEPAALGMALERMRAELQELYLGLEQQVSGLERRAKYLEATARVARDAASVLDPQELLSRVTNLISERLSFYHTGVFLLDPTGQWAVLQAASSEGGQRMLARGHRLRAGQEGIVGYVTGRGEARVALDVGADAVFFDNPDLPDTRSEMALPLQARGKIIGALDVQSTEPAAFSEEDVAVLQTLADQLAVAISNAQLFQQAQESLEAAQRAYGELSHQAWAEILRGGGRLGYYCDVGGVKPLSGASDTADNAIPKRHSDGARIVRASIDDGKLPAMSIPVTVRGGRVIGIVNAHKPDGTGEWTTEETTLMKTLVEQLSVAVESARLHQDTQRRAARERVVGEITTRMRESLDMQTVLKTAADQIYQALDLEEVMIRLATDEAGNESA